MNPILQCTHLTKTYPGKLALADLNLTLEPGRIVGLLGPNGSGKTTLIKLINGLLRPTAGKLLIDGNPPGLKTKKIVSYLPEQTYLGMHSQVKESLHFFQDFYEDFQMDRALDMLQKLEIDPNACLSSLSKGTREKVQLILVMSRRARLYCLDEPIAGVDPASRDFILSTILNNYEEEATILLSTHLISDVENLLDDFIFLKDGQILMHSSVEEIRDQSSTSLDGLFREVFRC